MFETIIQAQNSRRTGRKRTVLVSLVMHVAVLGVLIVVPLIYYQTIPPGWEFITDAFAATLPTPPPPAPPPSGPSAAPAPVRRIGPVIILTNKLIEPTNVPLPPETPILDIPIEQVIGSADGSGGALVPYTGGNGPLIPNVIGPTTITTPPPPPPKPPKQPMLISSLDPSRVIYRVEPVYPQIAIQTRVQGPVMLRIEVSEMGTVDSVEVVSGHPLLTKAAVEAVKQWRYKPTILNGEPVPVIATVTVNFRLTR